MELGARQSFIMSSLGVVKTLEIGTTADGSEAEVVILVIL
jgi:hypothetical protein